MTSHNQTNGEQIPANGAKPLFVAMILDKSGSMTNLSEATVDGFNEYLASQQREAPDTLMSVTLFDTACDEMHVAVPVTSIEALTVERYQRGGMGQTALNDAIGRTVAAIERGGYAHGRRVLVVVTTDGHENASSEWTQRSQIAAIIKLKEASGWRFVFFGAKIDAFLEGASLNIPASRSVPMAPSPDGTRIAYAAAARATTRYRSGESEETWTSELREPGV